MAVVYEAIDRKLGERRALKFSKSGHAHSIPPEARAALRVTHENVCRAFEIHTATTADGAADFISMEYVEGETLAKRWRREPLTQAEALDAPAGQGVAGSLCVAGLSTLAPMHLPALMRRFSQRVPQVELRLGEGDTETLLAAIEAWGLEASLQRAAGMWALALWDRRDRRLSLARDRFNPDAHFPTCSIQFLRL